MPTLYSIIATLNQKSQRILMQTTNTLCRILPRLHTPEIRDLAWCCFGPPLMTQVDTFCLGASASHFELNARRIAWLQKLDQEPDTLLEALQRKRSHRLGIYHEKLWIYFLDNDSETELITHNLPVRDANKTHGEFDLLYFCKRRDKAVHLEMTVKFYLGIASSLQSASQNTQSRQQLIQTENLETNNQWKQWIGPNTQDRLDIKLDKLFSQQILLSNTDAGCSTLANIGIKTPLKELRIAGFLFYPSHLSIPSPHNIDSHHQYGKWHYLQKFLMTAHCENWRFQLLEKKQWLTPFYSDNSNKLLDHDQLKSMLKNLLACKKSPALISALRKTNEIPDREIWQEEKRFFVVPDRWPFLNEYLKQG
jgi:hypothetical protein